MKEMNPEKSFVRGDYERLKTAVIRNISNDIKKVSNVKKFYLRDRGHFAQILTGDYKNPFFLRERHIP